VNRKQCRARCCLALAILSLAIPASDKWKEQVLYSFQGYPDGYTPAGGVIFGKDGSLYGATQGGGNGAAPGAVFQLRKHGNTGQCGDRQCRDRRNIPQFF
jgi:hypothetical protein